MYTRLEKVVPNFGKEERALCEYLSLLRNEELHSGSLPFETLKEVKWIGQYYFTCKALCEFIGKTLEEYIGDDTAVTATHLIKATKENIKKSALDKIAKQRLWLQQQPPHEQQKRKLQAETFTKIGQSENSREYACPACSCPGILEGELAKEHEPKYTDEQLCVGQEFLATSFYCLSCELKLDSLGEIIHSGIEPRFAKTRTTSLHELFEEDFIDSYMNE